MTPGEEQIYSIVTPYSGYYHIEVTSASGNVNYMWKMNSCSSTGWHCIDNINSPGSYGNMYWGNGFTYYILLDDRNDTPGTHTFFINTTSTCHTCPNADFYIIPDYTVQTHSSSHDIQGCKLYIVSINAGESYTFKTGCGDGATANYNTFLRLFNSDCNLLYLNDSGCENGRSIIEWNATYSGYAYIAINGNGGAGGNYTLAYFKCIQPPDQPDLISGQTSVCSGENQTYSVNPIAGANSYTWDLPPGWGGYSTTNQILVVTGESSGLISVAANNACGTGVAATLNVSVTISPPAPGPISGPQYVIAGSSILYFVPEIPEIIYYNWTFSGGGSVIHEGGTSAILQTFEEGLLSVTAFNGICQSDPAELWIRIIPQLLEECYSITGEMNYCRNAVETIITGCGNNAFYVQEYQTATFVAGQNIIMMNETYILPGAYFHAYIDLSGQYCNNVRSLPTVTEKLYSRSPDKDFDSTIESLFFGAYPNPTAGQFSLNLFTPSEATKIRVEIFNIIGDHLLNIELPGIKQHMFDISAIQSGFYLLRVTRGNETGFLKIIKQ